MVNARDEIAESGGRKPDRGLRKQSEPTKEVADSPLDLEPAPSSRPARAHAAQRLYSQLQRSQDLSLRLYVVDERRLQRPRHSIS